MNDTSESRRRPFQLSIRSLMIGSAIVAILLAPVAWVARERQQMLRFQREILRAREMALASVIQEERLRNQQAAASASSPEELRRENAALRAQVADLERQLGALRKDAAAPGHGGR